MYPILRDNLPASLFIDLWSRLLIPNESDSPDPRLKTSAFFDVVNSPIGLSSGIDLDGTACPKLLNYGLGFAEIGPIAATSQEFSGEAYKLSENGLTLVGPLSTYAPLWSKMKLVKFSSGPRGVDLVPLCENAISVPNLTDEDYVYTLSILYHVVDFFTVNLCSNPHLPIDYYQKPKRFKKLIERIATQRFLEIGIRTSYLTGLTDEHDGCSRRPYVPIYVKINTKWEDLQSLIEFCIQNGIDGIIVGDDQDDAEKSRKILEKTVEITQGRLEVISYGGVKNGKEVLDRIKIGAKVVQISSVLLEKGPKEYLRIKQELLLNLENEGFKDINEAYNSNNK